MSYQAQDMVANAIVNVRFATSSVAQGAAELLASRAFSGATFVCSNLCWSVPVARPSFA